MAIEFEGYSAASWQKTTSRIACLQQNVGKIIHFGPNWTKINTWGEAGRPKSTFQQAQRQRHIISDLKIMTIIIVIIITIIQFLGPTIAKENSRVRSLRVQPEPEGKGKKNHNSLFIEIFSNLFLRPCQDILALQVSTVQGGGEKKKPANMTLKFAFHNFMFCQ